MGPFFTGKADKLVTPFFLNGILTIRAWLSDKNRLSTEVRLFFYPYILTPGVCGGSHWSTPFFYLCRPYWGKVLANFLAGRAFNCPIGTMSCKASCS